jgi:hypothetical protein
MKQTIIKNWIAHYLLDNYLIANDFIDFLTNLYFLIMLNSITFLMMIYLYFLLTYLLIKFNCIEKNSYLSMYISPHSVYLFSLL